MIIKFAALLSAILVVFSFAQKVVKPIKTILEKIDMLEKQNKENYMSILRLTIMSNEIPLEERIAAGDKYVKNKGNGAVKHEYENLIKKL